MFDDTVLKGGKTKLIKKVVSVGINMSKYTNLAR